MQITKKSILTGKTRTMEMPITEAELARYHEGAVPIQMALPQLSVEQHEFLLTGIVPEEWAMVGEGEE